MPRCQVGFQTRLCPELMYFRFDVPPNYSVAQRFQKTQEFLDLMKPLGYNIDNIKQRLFKWGSFR